MPHCGSAVSSPFRELNNTVERPNGQSIVGIPSIKVAEEMLHKPAGYLAVLDFILGLTCDANMLYNWASQGSRRGGVSVRTRQC